MQSAGTYQEHPVPAIELLGLAKNSIAEVKEMDTGLPQEFQTLLSGAYALLAFTQDYLYQT